MKVDLHYGEGSVSLDIPEANISQIIRPWTDDSGGDNGVLVRDALSEHSDFVQAIAQKRLCVLVGDGTRDMPLDDIFGQLFKLFCACSHVRFMICTGTHRPDTPQNETICESITAAAKAAGLSSFDIHVHDCFNDELIDAGTTSRGTKPLYNAKISDSDVFCVLSDVKFHYFAGYSNPIKNFVPGICSYRTAEQNHSFALDERSRFGLHPWQNDENRRDNPLAADQLEAMELIVKDRPVYSMVTISSSGRIQWARFGRAEEVCRAAFDESDRRNTHFVTPEKRLIVSPGGLPNDVDLYISQRALELTSQAVVDGGEVLFLSACPGGVGDEHTRENFYDRLRRPIDEILGDIEAEYRLFSHKPYKFAQMIQRLSRIWVYSEMDEKVVRAGHLYPTDDPQIVVDGWINADSGVGITIVDGANKLALYA